MLRPAVGFDWSAGRYYEQGTLNSYFKRKDRLTGTRHLEEWQLQQPAFPHLNYTMTLIIIHAKSVLPYCILEEDLLQFQVQLNI